MSFCDSVGLVSGMDLLAVSEYVAGRGASCRWMPWWGFPVVPFVDLGRFVARSVGGGNLSCEDCPLVADGLVVWLRVDCCSNCAFLLVGIRRLLVFCCFARCCSCCCCCARGAVMADFFEGWKALHVSEFLALFSRDFTKSLLVKLSSYFSSHCCFVCHRSCDFTSSFLHSAIHNASSSPAVFSSNCFSSRSFISWSTCLYLAW